MNDLRTLPPPRSASSAALGYNVGRGSGLAISISRVNCIGDDLGPDPSRRCSTIRLSITNFGQHAERSKLAKPVSDPILSRHDDRSTDIFISMSVADPLMPPWGICRGTPVVKYLRTALALVQSYHQALSLSSITFTALNQLSYLFKQLPLTALRSLDHLPL